MRTSLRVRRIMSRTSYTAIAKPYDEFVKTVCIGMATTIKPQTHIQSGRVEISCAGPETIAIHQCKLRQPRVSHLSSTEF